MISHAIWAIVAIVGLYIWYRAVKAYLTFQPAYDEQAKKIEELTKRVEQCEEMAVKAASNTNAIVSQLQGRRR